MSDYLFTSESVTGGHATSESVTGGHADELAA